MDTLDKFVPLFFNGGWVVLVIGAAGMVARLATSKNPEDKTPQQILSNILAAMIASMLTWFIMEQFTISSMYKAIAYGLVGLNSPEILSGILKISTGFANDPTNFMKNLKSGSLSPKPTIKSKPKKKPRTK